MYTVNSLNVSTCPVHRFLIKHTEHHCEVCGTSQQRKVELYHPGICLSVCIQLYFSYTALVCLLTWLLTVYNLLTSQYLYFFTSCLSAVYVSRCTFFHLYIWSTTVCMCVYICLPVYNRSHNVYTFTAQALYFTAEISYYYSPGYHSCHLSKMFIKLSLYCILFYYTLFLYFSCFVILCSCIRF